ncbi:Ribosomal silencing factor RsfS [bacterium HR17]|jgi:ribosome-associated protein|uniref:Ribosomal silencing factor RsfS n=1 Tax=Candidatus Fervidibacter japonicus TaxID=2035412 RepID=A0A2H5XD73_9BACT|nr:Ribosomal silencing factor RsfS [bacterium HR17]
MVLTARDKAEFFCRIADAKKVSDIVVLEVKGLTPIADYFVLGTCENALHIEAVAEEMELRAKHDLGIIVRRSGEARSNWVVLDADEVLVHLFNPDLRDYYDLETLWAAAPRSAWIEGALRAETFV